MARGAAPAAVAALALGIVLAAVGDRGARLAARCGRPTLAVGACATALGRDRTCEDAATAVLLALAVVLGALRGATEQLPRRPHRARGARFRVGVPVVKVEGPARRGDRCAGRPAGRD